MSLLVRFALVVLLSSVLCLLLTWVGQRKLERILKNRDLWKEDEEGYADEL